MKSDEKDSKPSKLTNLTDEEKLALVEFKDDDSPSIRAMKSELQIVLAMPPDERKLFYQEQRVAEAENYLQWMIDCNKRDDEFIAYCTSQAKKLMQDIQQFGMEQEWLDRAELWTECATGTKGNKFTLTDIRKQRERIWQEKRKLKTMQQNAEQKPSSSHSES